MGRISATLSVGKMKGNLLHKHLHTPYSVPGSLYFTNIKTSNPLQHPFEVGTIILILQMGELKQRDN